MPKKISKELQEKVAILYRHNIRTVEIARYLKIDSATIQRLVISEGLKRLMPDEILNEGTKKYV